MQSPDQIGLTQEQAFEAREAILEQLGDESISTEDSIDLAFDAQAIQDEWVQKEAKRRATKILKKNKREIERLKKHAENCLLTGNKEGYIYAINKLRDIYHRPKLKRTELEFMWNTSYGAAQDIIKTVTK
ncbi:a-gt.4 conserved hypothetical protein [Acinetobacter phage Ac42]|uniref:a-gt.4 conserved hypothetical protein n=1 Tax=Acinetobacter phage Ac42 TaxID=762660 RepID=UPI0001EBCD06|nr:a-gt.4 conserved hypothetical protein [Acinetobacter phage Ac42]ADI96346.1 a-gt.4 conserved hypothetical protein [Acinetobacter phage Ac42]